MTSFRYNLLIMIRSYLITIIDKSQLLQLYLTNMFLSKIVRRLPLATSLRYPFSVTGESSFLEMVGEYLDKAGETAGIPKDRLNFLKSPDFSLKFNIPFLTGRFTITQTQDSSK